MGNIIQMIMNLFFGGNKKKEVKELDKAIKVKDNEVKELEKEVEVLESKKKVNKKEVAKLKRKIPIKDLSKPKYLAPLTPIEVLNITINGSPVF